MEKDIYCEFLGQKIKLLRIQHEKEASEVAKYCEISEATYYRIEENASKMRLSVIFKLCELYSLDPVKFLKI